VRFVSGHRFASAADSLRRDDIFQPKSALIL